MDIKILDSSLTFVAMIDDFESVVINRKYADIESIVITINTSKKNTEHLKAGNYVFVDDKLNKFFRIYNTKKNLNKEGITITATGFSIMQMFKQRITIPATGQATEGYTDTTEAIIKSYINSNCIASSDAGMNYSLMDIAPNHGIGSTITDETRYKNLYDEVIRLTTIDDLGIKSTFDIDDKKLVFDVYEGDDKTAGNTAGNNPVIFSTIFDNILEATIEETQTVIQNYALVGGQGESADRVIQVVNDDETGMERHVFFIDASDLATTDELTSRGQSQLLLPSYYIDAVINPTAQPKYEADYDIGDLVTVVVDGLQLNTRIVELTETYQGNTFGLNVIFGNKTIDLATLLNRSNSRLAKLETV